MVYLSTNLSTRKKATHRERSIFISTKQNKANSRRIHEEACNQGNLAVPDELGNANLVLHDPFMTVQGTEGYH